MKKYLVIMLAIVMKRSSLIIILIAAFSLMYLVPTASAGSWRYDNFYACVEEHNASITNLGDPPEDYNSGHNGGEWFYYRADSGPLWWNQWFYNDPLDLDATKEIHYSIEMLSEYYAPNPDADEVKEPQIEVAINWTDKSYTDEDNPPPPMQNDNIRREIVYEYDEYEYEKGRVPLYHEDPIVIAGEFTIFDFNPVWVSIDVRLWENGVGFMHDGSYVDPQPFGVDFSGTIDHRCIPNTPPPAVPEPSTIVLLLFGIFGVVGISRRSSRRS